jgi:hypothetical protein
LNRANLPPNAVTRGPSPTNLVERDPQWRAVFNLCDDRHHKFIIVDWRSTHLAHAVSNLYFGGMPDDTDDDIIETIDCTAVAACSIAAEHLGYAGMGEFIADVLASPEFIAGMFHRTYRGMERRCDHIVAVILCAGELASGGSGDSFPSRARDEATRIVEEHDERIDLLAEVIVRLSELDAEPIEHEGDIDVCETVVEQVDHQVAAA